MPYIKPASETDASHGWRFAVIAAAVCAVVSFLPYLYGLLLQPVDKMYLGYEYNTDDHMVYSAWMRQAQEGQFFFDNRFAVEEQPKLTVHVYFFVLGLVSKITGLSLAAALAKAIFSGLFVILLYHLLFRLTSNNFVIKLALSIAVVGGGVGFLFWHRFGEAIVAQNLGSLGDLMLMRLPTDVWQPEAYVFPSMLTNSLFMVSLCLIVGIFLCVLECRESWRPVLPGFFCFALLTNIHSYDVLTVGLVLVAFLAASLASRTASILWIARVIVMALGIVGPALWFWHVLQLDPVFQARAETLTYSPNFRQVFFGLVVMIGLGLVGLYQGMPGTESRSTVRKVATLALAVGLLILYVQAGTAYEGYWMDKASWGIAFAISIAFVMSVSSPLPGWNLFVSWAIVGLIAIYFPALFQRKLSMGMGIPWGAIAAVGLWQATTKSERGMRNLVGALAILLLSGSSVRWFLREGEFIRNDVSRTTLHPVFLNDDAKRILAYLDKQEGRKVVLAMPGISTPKVVEDQILPDQFDRPYLPDLNAIVSGLTGAYTYAGHWSETPKYLDRRNETTKFFLTAMTDQERRDLIAKIGVTHVLAPVQEAYPDFYERTGFQLADMTTLGTVVMDGPQFRLIEILPR